MLTMLYFVLALQLVLGSALVICYLATGFKSKVVNRFGLILTQVLIVLNAMVLLSLLPMLGQIMPIITRIAQSLPQ